MFSVYQKIYIKHLEKCVLALHSAAIIIIMIRETSINTSNAFKNRQPIVHKKNIQAYNYGTYDYYYCALSLYITLLL